MTAATDLMHFFLPAGITSALCRTAVMGWGAMWQAPTSTTSRRTTKPRRIWTGTRSTVTNAITSLPGCPDYLFMTGLHPWGFAWDATTAQAPRGNPPAILQRPPTAMAATAPRSPGWGPAFIPAPSRAYAGPVMTARPRKARVPRHRRDIFRSRHREMPATTVTPAQRRLRFGSWVQRSIPSTTITVHATLATPRITLQRIPESRPG